MATKHKRAALLIGSAVAFSVASEAWAASDNEGAWRIYSQEPNGDVHLFDKSRIEQTDKTRKVWNRIRYKTSVMGASSYQSLLEIDCSKQSERILQNTFFSDKDWKEPAMNTDRAKKPKRQIVKGSATDRLSKVLCAQ